MSELLAAGVFLNCCYLWCQCVDMWIVPLPDEQRLEWSTLRHPPHDGTKPAE